MSQLVKVRMRLNNDSLGRSLRLLAAKSDRLPSYLANKSCHWIAKRAEANMPVVSPARISSEMNQTTGAVEMATGKLAAKHLRRTRSLTMAQKIVLARMHPGSNYNIRTGHVFALQPPPGSGGGPTGNRRYKLGGQAQTKFWEWVDAHATRMVAAKRSSSGFFKVCASVVKWIFAQGKYAIKVPAGMESVEAQPGGGNVSKNIGRLAGGTLAGGNQVNATASFWITTTEPDTKGVPGRALARVAQPIWQRAADAEAASIREKAEKLYGEAIKSAGLVVK